MKNLHFGCDAGKGYADFMAIFLLKRSFTELRKRQPA